jgi:uncharacterized protein
MNSRHAILLGSLTILLLVTGCGVQRTQLMRRVRSEMLQSPSQQAYQDYKKSVGKTEDVDKLLNLGLLAFEAEDYPGAFAALSDADRLAEERETKSLSREAAGLAVSDMVRAYQGTVFDKAMLHYYLALAYLAQNNLSEATVEGRAIAQYLEVNSRESKHTYKDDAYLQWFSGSLYDAFGQTNDALISYKRARQMYGNYYGIVEPTYLCPVTLEAAYRVGDTETAQALDSLCGDAPDSGAASYGRVIVICEAGLAPPIEEENIVLPIFGDDPQNFADDAERQRYAEDVCRRRGEGYSYEPRRLKYLLRVAMPKHSPDYTGSQVQGAIIREDSSHLDVPAEFSDNIGAILRQDLSDRYPAILARAVVRGIIKYAATEAAKKAGRAMDKDHDNKWLGDVLGAAMNAAGVISEAADTRSWETLPDRIYVADFNLSPGTHHLHALFKGGAGESLQRNDLPEVTVKTGEVTFLRVRCMD